MQSDPLNRTDPFGLKDWPWPLNGRIKVDSEYTDKNVRGVEIDNRQVCNLRPGENTPWDDDVDFAECDGKWYMIGAANFEVKSDDKGCCKCPDRFREATPDERKVIEDMIKNLRKK